MRLVDDEDMSQEAAAERMDVSRPTLCRILAEARSVVAKALGNGWAIRIEGGAYVLEEVGSRQGSPCPDGPPCNPTSTLPGPRQGRGHCFRNRNHEEKK